MTEQEILVKITQLETEVTSLKAENASLKATIKQAVDTVKTVVKNDSAEIEQRITGRITSFLGDRLDDAIKIGKKNEAEILDLHHTISGDGDQDPGLRAQVKEALADTTELKLDKRDRETRSKTRTGLLTAIWTFGGVFTLGILVSVFKGFIDEKAQNAIRVQTGNEQEFAAIKAKAEKNNEIFFNSISSLNVFRGKAEADLEWLKKK